MGRIQKHPPVKLILGFIFKENPSLEKALSVFKQAFGRIDSESDILSFSHTDYYLKELGPGLKRKFVSFEKLIAPERLAAIKIFSNKIEQRLSRKGNRSINIDPGYVDMAKLALASTKNYMHRIYIGKGIFAEITLSFQGGTFKPWDWTYADYRTEEYIDYFNQVRNIYSQQLNRKTQNEKRKN